MDWPTHILLVDDHPLFRDGLSQMLREVHPAVAVQHAGGVTQALAHLSERPRPELILLDMTLPDIGGLAALELIRQAVEAPLVVVSAVEDPVLVRQCIEAGAMGYITKSSDLAEMKHAFEQMLSGRVYLPAFALAGHGLVDAARPDPLQPLTPRQRDVLRHLVEGKSNKLIARALGISEATVKSHVTVVLQVLGVEGRAQVVFTLAKLGVPMA